MAKAELHITLKVTGDHLKRRIRNCIDCPFGRRYSPESAERGWGPTGRFKSCVHPTHPQKHAGPDSPPPETCELRKVPVIFSPAPIKEEPFWLPGNEPARSDRTDVRVEGDTFSVAHREHDEDYYDDMIGMGPED